MTVAPRTILAFCILATQRWLVRRLEWLTLWPNCSDFPQISHFMKLSLSFDGHLNLGVKCLASNAEYYHKPSMIDKHGIIN